ncbi:NmrA family NAD(P)-binding protein [Klenkia sp. LSe6-5]|uniref:NmrA family NAD(P)-binding protein n=1 Tax=Klenkia sesuvii TaxID=3103137 RepID=A0ABU8DQE2_9ACTN
MTRLITVTGATGALGGRVARLLAEQVADHDAHLRLVVRDPSRTPQLPGTEVVGHPGGYADEAGFTAALAGTHTLFLVSAAEAVDRTEQHLSAVRAAVAAGVERIVYTSFLGSDDGATFTLTRTHAATEAALGDTGLRTTVLRNSMYSDFVPFFATPTDDGGAVIAAPAGDGAASFVSRDDAAEVAAAVLLRDHPSTDGRVLDVTGPEALTLGQAAAVLTEVTGRPVRYEAQTVEQAWATRRPSGAPDWEVEGWVTSFTAIAAGELAVVSDVVRSFTGHPATTVRAHLERHPEDWASLRR